MALFGGGSSKRPRTSGGVATLVGDSTEIRGDVLFSGGLHLDGRIIGKVSALVGEDASLSVSETGSIEGDVSAPMLMINGVVAGNLYASERLVLAPKAQVTGNVYYKVLEVQPGAELNGQLVHDPHGERGASAAEPRGPASRVDLDERRQRRIAS